MMVSSVTGLDIVKNVEDLKEEMPNTLAVIEENKLDNEFLIESEISIKDDTSKTNRIFVWLLEHTEFLRASEIARLFCLNRAFNRIDNEAFWKVQAKRTYPMNKVMEKVKGDRSWKQYYQHCFDLFGQDGELNYVQIIGIAKDIRVWLKENAPRIHETLNDGVDITQLSSYLKKYRPRANRGHLALWTEIDGQNAYQIRRYDSGFFGGFEFYNIKGNMHLLSVKKIHDWLHAVEYSDKICHCIGYGAKHSNYTVELYSVLMNDGALRKLTSGDVGQRYPQGGGSFVGFFKWYRDALYQNVFRIEQHEAINRMPWNDKCGSETITDGLRIRVRTLYVPETNPRGKVNFTYEYALDSVPGQLTPEGILTTRHFEIGEDGRIQYITGPGVIGLYPRIGPDMEVFRWNSCVRFSRGSRECWMQGSFCFRLDCGREFRANISRFYFNWRDSPIV